MRLKTSGEGHLSDKVWRGGGRGEGGAEGAEGGALGLEFQGGPGGSPQPRLGSVPKQLPMLL